MFRRLIIHSNRWQLEAQNTEWKTTLWLPGLELSTRFDTFENLCSVVQWSLYTDISTTISKLVNNSRMLSAIVAKDACVRGTRFVTTTKYKSINCVSVIDAAVRTTDDSPTRISTIYFSIFRRVNNTTYSCEFDGNLVNLLATISNEWPWLLTWMFIPNQVAVGSTSSYDLPWG